MLYKLKVSKYKMLKDLFPYNLVKEKYLSRTNYDCRMLPLQCKNVLFSH